MKKRKTMVAAFLLAAVMGIGVGYAAVSNTLKANGSVIIPENEVTNEFNSNVYFQSVVGAKDGDTVLASASIIDGSGNDSIEFSVTGLKPSDLSKTVTVKAVIANLNTYAVNIAFSVASSDQKLGTFDDNGTFTSKDGIFTITTNLGAAQIAASDGTTATILEVAFTATLNKLPTASVNDAFIIALEATPISTSNI